MNKLPLSNQKLENIYNPYTDDINGETTKKYFPVGVAAKMKSPVSIKGGQKASWWIYRTEIQQKNTTEIITCDESQKSVTGLELIRQTKRTDILK